MKYKIIAGPTQMRVERYNYKSEPIDIGNEYIASDNQKAQDFYYEHMHVSCQEYIKLRWAVKCIEWKMLREIAKELVEMFPTMYFDGPSWVMSIVPWKQAKYGEWMYVPKKLRWLLKNSIVQNYK